MKKIALAVSMVLLAFCLIGCQESTEAKYNKAQKFMTEKKYDEAAKIFDEINTYEDLSWHPLEYSL